MHTCCTCLLLPPIRILSALSNVPSLIRALFMHLTPALWAWKRAPATNFLGARILITLSFSTHPAALSDLPQHLPSPFTVIVVPLSTGPYLGLLDYHLKVMGTIASQLKALSKKHTSKQHNTITSCISRFLSVIR